MVFKLKKWHITAVLSIHFLILFVLILNCVKIPAVNNLPVTEKTVIVDAGHGGRDPGANTGNISEKDINLKIALYLEKYLKQSGCKVIMTRTTDKLLLNNENAPNKKREDLLNRRNIVNTSGGDCFVSIHLNTFSDSKYKGAQVFYQPQNPKSLALANSIQNKMIYYLDRENNRLPQKIADNKFLYRDLKVPSVLAECGFLSNPDEAKLLNLPEYQQKIAFSIYMGLIDYFSAN